MARPQTRHIVFDPSYPQPEVPRHIGILLNRFITPLKAWISALVYHVMLARSPHHPLVLIDRAYDPASIIEQCKDYRDPKGHATYTIETLVRSEIVRSLYGSCSDPALEYLLKDSLIARWYTRLPFFDPTPDHSTLKRFHTWTQENCPEGLFDDVLDVLDQIDPEDPATTPQIIDTFGMQSPAAVQSPAIVLMRLTAEILMEWEAFFPRDKHPILPPDLDLKKLRKSRAARSKEKGQRQLAHAVATARQVIAAIQPHLDLTPAKLLEAVSPLIALIEKVIEDETTTDKEGNVIEKAAKDRGSFRIVSATDPEASFRKHGEDTTFGYNAAISVTLTRIRAVIVMTGSTPDSEAPELILKQQKEKGQELPEQVVMDSAGGQGKVRARVQAVSEGKTEMVARLMAGGGRDENRYGPTDFVVEYDETGKPIACRCPNRKETQQLYNSQAGDGVHARFKAKEHCEGCEVWGKCRAPASKKDGNRTVFISEYQSFQRIAAAFNETEEGQMLLKGRWRVEPVVSWLANYQGCRRARCVGQAAAHFQLLQACAVRNLLSWVHRVRRGQASIPPRPVRGRRRVAAAQVS